MASSRERRPRNTLALVIIGAVVTWIYVYNLVVKDQGPIRSFFEVVDTLSEDVLLDSLVTIVVGLGIVLVFTLTKLYTQIIAEGTSFRILERIVGETVARGDFRGALSRLLEFQEEEEPDTVYPHGPAAILFSFAMLYVMSWTYLVLFSEALFFVSWSAGVDLPITESNLQLLPTLALAIPFSARVMAYFRYPYAQDYADFMPGALFVLLLVASLGYLFQSPDQKFFLLQVWQSADFLWPFLRNGLVLAFLPVFSEACFWMLHLYREKTA